MNTPSPMHHTPAQGAQIVGLAWYEAESFQAVRRLMADQHNLFDSHAKWLAKAERNEQILGQQGKTTMRVVLDTERFPAWCAARGLSLNTQARMDYAALIAAQAHRHGEA